MLLPKIFHVNVRVAAREGPKVRNKPAGRERTDDAHGEHLANGRSRTAQDLIDATKGVGNGRQKRFAFLSQNQPAREPSEQTHTECIFQTLHMLADRRLRHPKLEARLRESSVSGSGIKRTKRLQRQLESLGDRRVTVGPYIP